MFVLNTRVVDKLQNMMIPNFISAPRLNKVLADELGFHQIKAVEFAAGIVGAIPVG
jgi:hypothetical protein